MLQETADATNWQFYNPPSQKKKKNSTILQRIVCRVKKKRMMRSIIPHLSQDIYARDQIKTVFRSLLTKVSETQAAARAHGRWCAVCGARAAQAMRLLG